jgi:hypothetical protein
MEVRQLRADRAEQLRIGERGDVGVRREVQLDVLRRRALGAEQRGEDRHATHRDQRRDREDLVRGRVEIVQRLDDLPALVDIDPTDERDRLDERVRRRARHRRLDVAGVLLAEGLVRVVVGADRAERGGQLLLRDGVLLDRGREAGEIGEPLRGDHVIDPIPRVGAGQLVERRRELGTGVPDEGDRDGRHGCGLDEPRQEARMVLERPDPLHDRRNLIGDVAAEQVPELRECVAVDRGEILGRERGEIAV